MDCKLDIEISQNEKWQVRKNKITLNLILALSRLKLRFYEKQGKNPVLMKIVVD
jgi:hypothetical protein